MLVLISRYGCRGGLPVEGILFIQGMIKALQVLVRVV